MNNRRGTPVIAEMGPHNKGISRFYGIQTRHWCHRKRSTWLIPAQGLIVVGDDALIHTENSKVVIDVASIELEGERVQIRISSGPDF